MVTEIELKAHVKDKKNLKLRLSEKAEYICAFEKEDTYWFLSDRDEAAESAPGKIRLRREKRILSDGTGKSAIFVTFKTKEVKDGIEINDEREFELSSPSSRSETDFEEFAKRIGYKPGAYKKKKGWAYSAGGISAELVEVKSLGWFIELEILADNKRSTTILKREKKLLDFLDSLGIEREAIESRFYSEMLAKADKT